MNTPRILPTAVHWNGFCSKWVSFLTLALLLFAGLGEARATTYTWNTATSGTWSKTSNWTSTSGTFPGAGDTANIYGSASTYNITYDAAESGTLGTLNMVNTTGVGAIYLNLNRSLTLTGGGALSNSFAGGHMNLVLNADNVTVTIGDGTNASTFSYGSTSSTSATGEQLYLGSASYTNSKIVIANASTLKWINAVSSGNLTMGAPLVINNGGTLTLETDISGAGSKYYMSNLTVNSGGKVNTAGTYAGTSSFYLTGSSDVINGQISGFTSANTGNSNGGGVVLYNAAAVGGTSTQSIAFGTGSNAIDIGLRPQNVGAGTTSIALVSSNATGSVLYTGTGSNIIDSFNFYGGSTLSGNTLIMRLGSNLTYSGSGTNFAFYYASTTSTSSVVNDLVDLNGLTYDLNGKSYAPYWSGATNSTSSVVGITNSGSSAAAGTLKAGYFNLGITTNGGANTSIGSYVTLQATSASALNNLSNTVGSGAIDPTSTFLYTAAGVSTLVSNRNIGNITVGSGSSASTLSLGSAITASGVVTVSGSGILDLYNGSGTGSSGQGTVGSYSLTAAGLSGSGIIQNKLLGTGSAPTSATLTLNNNGASGIPTTNTFSGSLTDGGGAATLSLTLASTNIGTQILSGSSTYTGATTINGGTLIVNGSLGNTAVTIGSGATLGGSGTIAGTVTGNSGIINGGGLSMGATTLHGASTLSGTNSASSVTIADGTTTLSGTTTAGFTLNSAATLAGSGNANGTVAVTSGTVSGSGLTLGATTITGASTLSGYNIASSVNVASGTTSLTGTTHSTSALSVTAGATLNANGTIQGSATVSGLLKGNSIVTGNLSLTSGTLAPGNSPGLTTVGGNFSMNPTSTLVAEVTGTAAGISYDQVKVSGIVSLAGTLDLSVLNGLTLGDTVILIDNTSSGTTTGFFSTIVTSGSTYTLTSDSDTTFTVSGKDYLLSFNANADGDNQFNDVTLSVVPEPGTWAMLVGGLGMLMGCQRLRKSRMGR